ncbi:MAG TPA: hypothetical protein VIS10_06155 [Anaerolineales bacterium]
MKATSKFTKEILFLVALALTLALLAGLSGNGARPAAARPAFQEGTSSPALTQEPPSPAVPQVTPSLTIQKIRNVELAYDADGDGNIDPGDKVSYTIRYQNTGPEPVTGVTIEDAFSKELVANVNGTPMIDAVGATIEAEKIIWVVEDLPPGRDDQVDYVITIKGTLTPGPYTLNNAASILINGTPIAKSVVSEEVVVPTATPTPTSTPSPTPSPTVQPTSTPPVTSVGVSNLQDPRILWPMVLATLAPVLGGLVVLGLIAIKPEILEQEERSRVIRVGFVVTLTVGAVLVMGVFGGIERGAAAGILGTVAGYLLRGVKEG